MIKVDGVEYVGVTRVFDPKNPPRHLVTYTVDGEQSETLYTKHGSSDTELARFLTAYEEGRVQNLKFWKLDVQETDTIKGSILEPFGGV